MKILITGVAGFIGAHLGRKLLSEGHEICGVDNLNDYYDVELKKARLKALVPEDQCKFATVDISDREALFNFIKKERPKKIVNLAAQAGVRYSLQNPSAYVESNLVGFVNILEACRQFDIQHLVYASTSSVYGINTQLPFSEHADADHPASLYAATKRANELLAHAYSHMFSLPTTGLRFFTVYGPWGRPDMALFLFTKNILEGRPIEVFNHGKHKRDFTYIEDIIQGVSAVTLGSPPAIRQDVDRNRLDPAVSTAPFRVYNIGNSKPESLQKYISVLEGELGKKAEQKFLPMQAGDVEATFADTSDLQRDFGYLPKTSIEVGIKNFVKWHRDFYKR